MSDKNEVYKAIVAVALGLSKEGIAKTQRNKQGEGYNYRGIDDVYNALAPLLAEHKLCILPDVLERECTERVSNAGKPLFYTIVKVRFSFVSAIDGSAHEVTTYGEAMDSADKSTNKAMSAAYKYAAFQAFCIPTEGDNDADAHTPDPAPKSQNRPHSGPQGGRELTILQPSGKKTHGVTDKQLGMLAGMKKELGPVAEDAIAYFLKTLDLQGKDHAALYLNAREASDLIDILVKEKERAAKAPELGFDPNEDLPEGLR